MITGGSGFAVAFNNDLTTSNYQSDGSGYHSYAAASENLYQFQLTRGGSNPNFNHSIILSELNF